MFEESPILCCKNSLDEMVRQILQFKGIILQNAAGADFIAKAIKEGNGIVFLSWQTILGQLEV